VERYEFRAASKMSEFMQVERTIDLTGTQSSIGAAKVSLASRIAKQIAGQITSGALKRGEQLPTETALCTLHGVSRITIRGALEQLQRHGLIERFAGKGTFVTSRGALGNWRLDSIEDLVQATIDARSQIISWRLGKPVPEARAFFNSGNDKNYILRAVRYAGNIPVYVIDAYIPLAIGSLLEADDLNHFTPRELFEGKLNMPAQRAVEEITLATARADVAALLRIKSGASIVRQDLQFHSSNGPLQYVRSWWHAKYFKRRYEISRR
jgi:DNA-binding GntR family transcriptional regulator